MVWFALLFPIRALCPAHELPTSMIKRKSSCSVGVKGARGIELPPDFLLLCQSLSVRRNIQNIGGKVGICFNT